MPDFDIDTDYDDLLGDVEQDADDAWSQYSSPAVEGTQGSWGTDSSGMDIYTPGIQGNDGSINTESLTNEQMASLSINPNYMAGMLTDLGVTDAGDYTKFINQFDFNQVDIANKKYNLNEANLKDSTRQGMLSQLGDPLTMNMDLSSTSGVEGVGGDAGGYLKRLDKIDVESAEKKFGRDLDANKLQKESTLTDAYKNYSDQFYRDAGDIYQQQQSKGGGGKK